MRGRDLAALVLLAAIWGSSYLFIRVAVEPLGPLVVALLRVVVAGLGLLAYAQFSRRRGELRALDIRFLTLGAANAAVPYSLISLAELHITASMAGILNATTPLFTAMVVAGWDKERISRRTMLGLVASGTLAVAAVGLAFWSVNAEGRFREAQRVAQEAQRNSIDAGIAGEAKRTDITGSIPGMRRHTREGYTPSGSSPSRTMSKCAIGKSRNPPLLQACRNNL